MKKIHLDGFFLKILAMVFMTLDHIGYFLLGMDPYGDSLPHRIGFIFRIIGTMALPLFVFLLAEGMKKSSRRGLYLLRLGILWAGLVAVDSVLTYAFSSSFGYNPFNDLILIGTMLFCLGLKGYRKIFALLPGAVLSFVYGMQLYAIIVDVHIYWFPSVLMPGYSIVGLLLGLAFYCIPKLNRVIGKSYAKKIDLDYELFEKSETHQRLENLLSSAALFFVVLLIWGIGYIQIREGVYLDPLPMTGDGVSIPPHSYCALAGILLLLYSGKRGYDSKWWRIFTYAYYPVHLALLWALFQLI